MRPRLPLLAAPLVLVLAVPRAPASAQTLVVLNKAEASASLVDPASGEIRATLPTGAGPHEVAVSPDGRLGVVADYGARAPGHTLTVLDLEAHEVVRTIDLVHDPDPAADSVTLYRPHGVEFLEDGEHVLVTVEQNRAVALVDVVRGRVRERYPTDASLAHMLVLSPDETRVYASNLRSQAGGEHGVSVIDLESGELVARIETGNGAEGLDVSPDGTELWVGNRGGDTLSIIDTQTLEVVDEVACGSVPIRVKCTPDGEHVLVSNARSGDLAIFDRHSREEVARVAMELTAVEKKDERLFGDSFGDSPVPVGILVEPSGARAYVANTNADIVTVVDLESFEIVGRLRAGTEPDGLGWTPLEGPAEG